IDRSRGLPDHQSIVGTYRLLRQDQADRCGGFYSASEFNLAPLLNRNPDRRFLELGRSCVLPEYRSKRTLELLWQGIWAYSQQHRIDVMIGCASFAGTLPARHAEPLSLLAHDFTAAGQWQTQALPHRFQSMALMPRDAIDP